METLALWTRSEMIGSALDQLCFLVSGVGFQVSEKCPIMDVQNIPGSLLTIFDFPLKRITLF
jgi:hypothetical protein